MMLCIKLVLENTTICDSIGTESAASTERRYPDFGSNASRLPPVSRRRFNAMMGLLSPDEGGAVCASAIEARNTAQRLSTVGKPLTGVFFRIHDEQPWGRPSFLVVCPG